jgi:peptide/bleomycin uptake transporter
MFASFFPRPAALFASAALWISVCACGWYAGFRDFGHQLNLPLVGIHIKLPAAIQESSAADPWLYFYIFISGAIFVIAWARITPHRWFRWSVLGTAAILFILWFQVQVDVLVNQWFRGFYDLIQKALGTPGSVTVGSYFAKLVTFLGLAMVHVTVSVLNAFLVSHFVFRWRTAMTDHYVANWVKLRSVEGAAQRVQEDTMRFAQTMEGLGVSFIHSIMTLVAFLPVLWGLSAYVKSVPILGALPQALVVIAIAWSVLGTGLLAIAGVRLPGLNFLNQKVEAAYRKELIFGEDDPNRAAPPTVSELFKAVRRNYFRLYLNYLYFNIVRHGYLQVGVLIPYVALAPTIAAAGFTLGIMQQILRAFGRITSSFQYLVNSWSTIVELLSIHKRLKAFDAALEKPC